MQNLDAVAWESLKQIVGKNFAGFVVYFIEMGEI
jgi:hypothetical protein